MRLDGPSRGVFIGSRRLPVRLSPKEFELLQYLFDRAGQICSREELGNHLWGSVEVHGDHVPRFDDHMLHALVHRLREKLRRAGLDLSRYLVSVPGAGYRLEKAPQPGEEELSAQPSLDKAILLKWAMAGAGAAVGLALVAVGLVLLLNDGDGGVDPSGSGTPGAAAELCAAEMIDPEPGSVLPGSTVTFKWTPGCNLNRYDLWVGCSPGAVDFYNAEDGEFLEATVTDLPTDGGPVFVWLTSSNGTEEGFFRPEYEYTAAAGEGERVVLTPGTETWHDTGIDLSEGQEIEITACGQVTVNATGYPTFQTSGDNECPGVWRFGFPAPDLPCWSLMGRLDNGEPFLIGPSYSGTAAASGRLYLGVNDDNTTDNSGAFRSTIRLGEVPRALGFFAPPRPLAG